MAFKNSTDEKFQDQIYGSKLNLIQFSASWCGPCQQLKPIIEKISNDMADKIDCYYHDIESQPEKLKILDDINAYVEDLEKYYLSA